MPQREADLALGILSQKTRKRPHRIPSSGSSISAMITRQAAEAEHIGNAGTTTDS